MAQREYRFRGIGIIRKFLEVRQKRGAGSGSGVGSGLGLSSGSRVGTVFSSSPGMGGRSFQSFSRIWPNIRSKSVGGDGEIQILPALEIGTDHTDNMILFIQKRTAAVAVGDGGCADAEVSASTILVPQYGQKLLSSLSCFPH